MKGIFILLLPLAAANLYKETQNFQYSRTGDGEEKKGYYGSQSGNMGGNFEVSHNMDTPAQRQMKGLVQQVGSQLGIDPHAIGTGEIGELGPSGSVYGSASTRGSAYGLKGVDGEYSRTGAGKYGSESRRSGGQSFGTQQREFSSAHGSRTAGQRVVGWEDQEQAGYDSSAGLRQTGSTGFDTSAGSSSGLRQTGATGRQYTSGSSRYNTNRYESSSANHGETGDIHGIDYQNTYTPVTGIRQVGLDSATAGSQYSAGSRYHSGSSAYDQSHHADVQRTTEERIPIIVRPGTTVRVTVPAQRVVLTRPARPGTPVYVDDVNYSTSAHGHNIDSQSQLVETEGNDRNYEIDTDQLARTGDNRGRTSSTKGFQSSYSYQKEWQRHGSTGDNVPVSGGTNVRPVSDVGRIAQNRDKLLVGGLEVGSEDQASTVYNSGSRVANTGRRYGGSQQTYRENNGESQQRGFNAQATRVASGSAYDQSATRVASGSAYDQTATNQEAEDSEVAGSQIHSVQTKPKSFQSSYSYQKSWEKHGTPYTIEPVGQATIGSGALNSQSGYRHNAENADLADRQSRYGESHSGSSSHSASSSRTAGGQYGAAYGATHGASGGSQTEALSADMAAMQQRLREQMGQMCTDCGNGKTKGYSAHYSYSAQRSYGGEAGGAQQAEHHRRRRSPYHHTRYSNYHGYDQREDMGQESEDDDITSNFDKLIKEAEEILKDIDRIQQNSRATQNSDVYQSHSVTVNTQHPRVYHHQTEDLGQETQDWGQQTENLGQQTQDWGQQTENLGQQTQDWGQQTENLGQQTQDWGQQTGNLGQQTQDWGQQTENSGHQTESFSQSGKLEFGNSRYRGQGANTQLGGETQGFTRSQVYHQNTQSTNIQANVNNYGNLNQPSEDLGQQTEDLGQQTQGFWDAGSENAHLGQQTENLGQQTEDLGQQTQDFSQSEVYDQHFPKLEVGLSQTGHPSGQTEDLGQQTEGMGQQPLWISESDRHNTRVPKVQNKDLEENDGFVTMEANYNYRPSPKLQAGSWIRQNEHVGQETDNIGQQTQGFSGSSIYTHNTGEPKLQVGSSTYQNSYAGQETEELGQQTEDLGQQTEDLGQQTEDLGQITVNSNKKLGDTARSHIEFDDNKSVDLQIGSILQQNEYFGRQEGNLQQSTIGMDDVGQETQNWDHGDIDSPISHVNAEYKSTTERNIRSQNSFNGYNKIHDKSYFDKDFKEKQKQNNEIVHSHLADLLKELETSNFHNDGHNTQSKMDVLQEQHYQPGAQKKLGVDTINKNKNIDVAIEQETPNSDEETTLNKKKDQEILEVVDETKPKHLSSHSFIAKENDEENENRSRERSFLDIYHPELHKKVETDQESTSTAKPKEERHQMETDLVKVVPHTEVNFEQVEDDGGQQTVVDPWTFNSSDELQVADNQNNQQKSLYTSDNTQQVRDLPLLIAPKENEKHLQNAIDNDSQVTTEKPGLWKKMSSGFDRAKEKAKSWFG